MVDGKEITLLSKELTPELLIKHKGQLVKALKDDPLSLANANDLVTNNRDIMISAVREKGVAVQFASPNIKRDPMVIIEALKENIDSI